MSSKSALEPITKPRILIVEGKDEIRFFTALIKEIELDDIQIFHLGGVQKFQRRLPLLMKTRGYRTAQSIGIVRDADNSFARAFQSVCDIIQNNGLPVPTEPLKPAGADPQVSIFILPDNAQDGMLEDLCLTCVEDDPAMECVQEYLNCISHKFEDLPAEISKARVRSFLASREFLEDAHFVMIADCLTEGVLDDDFVKNLSDSSVAKVHLFLASKYKPDLRVGEAAEAGYWPFNHPNLTSLKQFLRNF